MNTYKWSSTLRFADLLGSRPCRRRRGGGRGGWSKNNPYLQDRFVEYEISIDPPNLATRILSVREQITRELQDDLTLILKSNERSTWLCVSCVSDSFYLF
jgi:hypothetical protein